MSCRILLAGGSGFIGQRLAHRLLSRFDVVVVSRNAASASSNSKIRSATYAQLDELLADDATEAIVNLAGYNIMAWPWTKSHADLCRTSRIETTKLIVDSLMKVNNRRSRRVTFLQTSAVGIYGNRGAEVLDETAVVERTRSELTALVYDWENSSMKASDVSRLVIMRIPMVLAEDGGALLPILRAFYFGLGGRISLDGSQYWPFIHIDDLLSIYEHLLSSPNVEGIINCCAPETPTNALFTSTLADLLGRYALLHVPSFVLRTVLGANAGILLDSINTQPTRLLQSRFEFMFPAIRDALRDCTKSYR